MSRASAARRQFAVTLARIALARVADRMALVVCAWATLQAHGAGWAAVVGAAPLLPAVIGALVGPVFLSRFGGPLLSLTAGIAKAAGALRLAALLCLASPAPWLMAGMLAALAFLDMPARIAFEASRPPFARLARMPLLRLNGWEEGVDHAAAVAGPAAAALALATLGTEGGAILFAGMTLASTIALIAMLRLSRGPACPQPSPWAAMAAALRGLWHDNATRLVLILLAVGLGGFTGVEVVLLPAVLEHSATRSAVFLGALGTGALLGGAALLAGRSRLGQQPVGRVLAWSLASAALGLLAVAAAPAFVPALAAGGLLSGLAAAPVLPMAMTLLQCLAPRMLRPFAIGLALAVTLAGAPLAILLLGAVARVLPARELMLAVAFGFALLALAARACPPLAVGLSALRSRPHPIHAR